MSVIPDPEKPQRWAVDARTGDLLTGVQFVPALLNASAPTLRELEAGTTLWFKDGSVTFGAVEPIDEAPFQKFEIPRTDER